MKQFSKKFRGLLRWIAWVLVVQFALANISAALYAYKFTHFYKEPPQAAPRNFLGNTWRLFVGPRFSRLPGADRPPFAYTSVKLRTPGGIDIDAWYAGDDSVNRCVVFVHGITANKSFLAAEASRFRRWGYNVLLLDLRGHGASGGNYSAYGADETEELVEAFAFARKRGARQLILYGSSMGAALALKGAATGAVKPDAIIADMPFQSLQHHLQARARTLGFPEEPFASLVTFWMGVERGFNGLAYDVDEDAAAVGCPVLLQWGSEDPLVSSRETEAIYKSLRGDKKLAVYKGAGHESFYGYDPLKWEKEIGSFIGALQK